MAEVRPLRLKSQKYGPKPQVAVHLPYARILVDTPAFHLGDIFDYLVPESLSQIVCVGSLVKVPFGSQMLPGYVLERTTQPQVGSQLKLIDSIISPLPLLTPDLFSLLTAAGLRYGVKPWDLIRGAIPERVATVEKEFVATHFLSMTGVESKSVRSAAVTDINSDIYSQLGALVIGRLGKSRTVIVVPDEKSLRNSQEALERLGVVGILVLGSHLPRGERYRNFLKTYDPQYEVILGTRSAIFTSMPKGSTIIVLRDNDESMYDRRSPGWNVRDIALLRTQDQSVIFLSHSPSLEVLRLMEIGWLTSPSKRNRKTLKIVNEGDHRSHHQVIGDGLKRGSVLISVSEPGYVNSFLCSQCRNRAECSCGGRLFFPRMGALPKCSICEKEYPDWKCTWCAASKPWMIKRGTSRLALEYGRAFPGIHILTSTGERLVQNLPNGKSLVIATSGCEPVGRYSAAALLDGAVLFNRTQLRSDEVARERWLSALSLVEEGGEAFISLPLNDPVAQSILRGNYIAPAAVELEHRRSAHLPPHYRVAVVEAGTAKISAIYRGLENSHQFEVTPPIALSLDRYRLIIRCDVNLGDELARFTHDLQRHQSLKSESDLSIRLDPYSI
ncbi:MAG: hypothetical protein WCO08_03785 [Actinomycetes bacterium]